MARLSPRRPGVSLWVFVVLFAALALGGAAALLTAPVATNPPSYFYAPFDITVGEAGWLVIAVAVAWLVAHVVKRVHNGTALLPGRAIAVGILAILLAVAFVFVARFGGPPPTPAGEQSSPGGPGPPPTATVNNTTTNPTNNATAFLPFQLGGWSIPGWVVFAALLGVAAVVGVVALPLYLSARRTAGRPTASPPPGDARSDFAAALRTLSDPDAADVRATIIALYARLLARIGPLLGSVETRSPREIEGACVARFGIRPPTARALTALFEEARYSTHPLDDAAGRRARETFRQALADLDTAVGRAS